MTKQEFRDILDKKILVLDGATGTELQKRGMPKGVCPEKWVSENPQSIIDVQQNYKAAGSNIVYSCTFGANRYKLEEFGLQDEVFELNKRLAEISREAVGNDVYVAGDMSATGKFIQPFGEVPFNDAVEMYKEQVRGLLAGGVDFFVIETMIDIQELRAAILAVKESCDLPILATMTFDESGRSLTGTDAVTALITAQSLGASAFGCNCSTGPDKMIENIKKMKPFATIPLIAKPNAGLPKLVDGKSVYDMKAEEFGSYVAEFVAAGVNIMGGCCGTAPEYIAQIANQVRTMKPVPPVVQSVSAVSGARSYCDLARPHTLSIIGERINPTGKKMFQAQLKEGSLDGVRKFAMEQAQSGASILDVNMGMPGIDEKDMMVKSLTLLSQISELPLCLDSSSAEVMEAALRLYPGRALLNSISFETVKIEKFLPLAAKYGAMFIALPLTDDEIPKTADGRKAVLDKILAEADKYGFTRNDIVVDGIVMTVSADQDAAKQTLRFINICANEYNMNTTVGLSNVSFGLPERKLINSAFMSMAIYNGLSMAIANPNEEILINAKFASDVLVGNDIQSKKYIDKYSNVVKTETKAEGKVKTPNEMVFDAVVEGDNDRIEQYVRNALDAGSTAQELVDNYLIPGINKVGDLYDKKIYFLPQLIAAAEAMKKAFGIVEPLLVKDAGENVQKHKIIMATVKGDIHDIGKNIVILMLKNYGYEVIDMGKDVPSEDIVDKAIAENAEIIGLSALMTTTMTEMKTVVDIAKAKGCKAKIMIGGAVITQDYADEIGADGYSKDSVDAVKMADKLVGK